MDTIQRQKAALRREAAAAEAALTSSERHLSDDAILRHVLHTPEYRRAGTVFAFVGRGSEIDTTPLLRQVLADGKRLCVPLCTAPGIMESRQVLALSELAPGAYGIPEPPADRPAADPGGYAATLALIPCLAAGTDGVRLGRGGGYYDRFLAQYKGERLLLCPAAALLADLPDDDWDVRFAPDEILTEKGILR